MTTKLPTPCGADVRSSDLLGCVNLGENSLLDFRIAAVSDLSFIVDLEHKNKESLGFLPKMAIEERIKKSTIILGRLNCEPFGYLLYDRRGGDVNILQACIQYDARRRLYGAALYQWALAVWKPDFVRLKCAADLESNLFWRSMDLVCVAVVNGGKRRGRKINVWHHYLTPQLITTSAIPAYQRREDCKDIETGFLTKAPDGFEDKGSLGKLAWSNRKAKQPNAELSDSRPNNRTT